MTVDRTVAALRVTAVRRGAGTYAGLTVGYDVRGTEPAQSLDDPLPSLLHSAHVNVDEIGRWIT